MRLPVRILRSMVLLLFLCLPVSASGSPATAATPDNSPTVYSIDVTGPITAGNAAQIRRGIQTAADQGAQALVLRLDTPGGLVTATLDIVQEVLSAEVPVLVLVAPRGAIAASAGSFLLLSGHVAAMAPGTTTGAAMPVALSPAGEAPETADDKTVLFLAGHIRSIASERGRPPEVAERFVTENLTLETTEALDSGVIDLVAEDLRDLLQRVHGREIALPGPDRTLNTRDAEIRHLEMTRAERLTDLVSNPQLTFILILIGVYGLVIGFNSPGTFVPEVLGAICLVLGLYGLGLFEISIAALLMIVLGIGLLVAEAFTPTFGVLAVGGTVSLVLGILFLPTEPLMPARWFAMFRLMATGVGISASVFMVVLLRGILRLRRSRVVHGDAEFNGLRALVVEPCDPSGLVRVQGEIWEAQSADGQLIPEGDSAIVTGRRGMVLLVDRETAGADPAGKE